MVNTIKTNQDMINMVYRNIIRDVRDKYTDYDKLINDHYEEIISTMKKANCLFDEESIKVTKKDLISLMKVRYD